MLGWVGAEQANWCCDRSTGITGWGFECDTGGVDCVSQSDATLDADCACERADRGPRHYISMESPPFAKLKPADWPWVPNPNVPFVPAA